MAHRWNIENSQKPFSQLVSIHGFMNKNIIMSSFKSSGDIQKKEGGPDRWPSIGQVSTDCARRGCRAYSSPPPARSFSKEDEYWEIQNEINKLCFTTCRKAS